MTHPDLLKDYVDRKQLAAAISCSERTIARYENLPNGLPCVLLGGRKLYRIEAVVQWIRQREKHPNPNRRSQSHS